MILWNVSIITVLLLALIEFIRVLWCPKHRKLSHRKFLSGGNTRETTEIRVFKNKSKNCEVAMATYVRADWWNWTFLNGKYIERKVTKQLLQTPSRFEDVLWFRWGGAMCPSILDRVKKADLIPIFKPGKATPSFRNKGHYSTRSNRIWRKLLI